LQKPYFFSSNEPALNLKLLHTFSTKLEPATIKQVSDALPTELTGPEGCVMSHNLCGTGYTAVLTLRSARISYFELKISSVIISALAWTQKSRSLFIAVAKKTLQNSTRVFSTK
jgi:hypothetical protein